MSKSVKSVGKSVSGAVKSVSKGVSKIAQGKVGEGLGDVGQTFARVGLDTVTAGNKKLVDNLTAGSLTSAEMAARGNSKDIVRTGATAGALFAAGPGGAMAVNSGFAAGGFQGGLAAGLGSYGVPGAGLIAGAVSNIAGVNTMSPSPAPIYGQSPVVYSSSVPSVGGASGMNNSTMMIMGAGFLGILLIAVIFLASRGKR